MEKAKRIEFHKREIEFLKKHIMVLQSATPMYNCCQNKDRRFAVRLLKRIHGVAIDNYRKMIVTNRKMIWEI